MDELIEINIMNFDVLNDALYDLDGSDLSVILYEKAQNVLMTRTKELLDKSPAFIEFLEALKPKQLFDVNMSKSARELYDNGELILKYSKKKGGLLPTLSNSRGTFAEQVTLDKRQVTPELSSALSNLSMQSQLTQLMDQMKVMNRSIQRVEIGQRDDRIGLYLSARQQFIEALSIEDKNLQSYALMNAVNVANNAKHQLMQSIRSDVRQIVFNKDIKKKEKDKLSEAVRSSLRYVNETTGLCVMTYSALGEEKPLLASLKSYQCFIRQTLLEKTDEGLTIAQKLHQNWHGSDDEWLKMPEKIVSNLEEQILLKVQEPLLIEDEEESDG